MTWTSPRIWLLLNTSGLNAHYTPAGFVEAFVNSGWPPSAKTLDGRTVLVRKRRSRPRRAVPPHFRRRCATRADEYCEAHKGREGYGYRWAAKAVFTAV